MPKAFDKICSRCNQQQCNCKRQENRPNSAKRGYDRHWRRWREQYIRQRVQADTYHCDDCKRPFNQLTGGPELHHIVKVADDPRRMYDETNILLLHQECHSKRTARGE